MASRAIVPPIASAAASPTALVSVATARITNIRNAVITSSKKNDCACEPAGSVAPTSATSPSEARRSSAGGHGASQLSGPVARGARPGEMAREGECECDGPVEMRAGNVSDGIDHRHDHEAECICDADATKRPRLRVHHHRARPREHQRERPDRLGDEDACGRKLHQTIVSLRRSRSRTSRHSPCPACRAACVSRRSRSRLGRAGGYCPRSRGTCPLESSRCRRLRWRRSGLRVGAGRRPGRGRPSAT